jgi:hypothetical protein
MTEYYSVHLSRIGPPQQIVNRALVLITLGGNDFVNNDFSRIGPPQSRARKLARVRKESRCSASVPESLEMCPDRCRVWGDALGWTARNARARCKHGPSVRRLPLPRDRLTRPSLTLLHSRRPAMKMRGRAVRRWEVGRFAQPRLEWSAISCYPFGSTRAWPSRASRQPTPYAVETLSRLARCRDVFSLLPFSATRALGLGSASYTRSRCQFSSSGSCCFAATALPPHITCVSNCNMKNSSPTGSLSLLLTCWLLPS